MPAIRPPVRAKAPAPIRVVNTTTAWNCGVVASTWHDLDQSGNAAARTYDLVVPNVRVGQWVTLSLDCVSGATAASVTLDWFTVVAGLYVHQTGPITTGVAGASLFASIVAAVNVTASYQIAADDIENGAVRFRLRDRNNTTTARSLAVAGYAIAQEAHGPFG